MTPAPASPLPCEAHLRPIPLTPVKRTSVQARAVPIVYGNPLFDDPLVDLVDLGFSTESYYARGDGLNAPYYRSIKGAVPSVYVRSSLVPRLLDANHRLRHQDLELHCLDGYRPVACQQGLWEFFMDAARKALTNPTPEACYAYVTQYCSDPTRFNADDSTTWPTHLTGGSIDLTLRRRNGELLYMGGVFDDASEVSNTDHYEVRALAGPLSMSDQDALRNRRILYHAMIAAGFTNYDFEWWHYDHGNAFWAMNSGSPHSLFGPATFNR